MLGHVVLTIITITLNDSVGIRKTGESMDGQTMRDQVEWIVVNGNPNDSDCRNYLDGLRYPPEMVINEFDDGIYDAMNKGLAVAQGEYAQFLNGGDYLASSEAVGNVIAAIGANPGHTIVAKTRKANNEGSVWPKFPVSPIAHLFGLQMHAHPSFVAQTKGMKQLGGFPQNFGFAGDFHLVARILLSRPVFELNQVVAIFSGGGVSSEHSGETPKLLAQCRDDILRPKGVAARAMTVFNAIFALRYQIALIRSRRGLRQDAP